MNSEPWVLIVGAGHLQIPVVEAAHRLGLLAHVTDRNRRAPARALADDFTLLDTYDSRGHANLARELKRQLNLVGVFTAAADVEVTVATAAWLMDLPGIDPSSAEWCANKDSMRISFSQTGIPGPRVQYIVDAPPVFLPAVIKPTDNCASRGTTIVRSADEWDAAVKKAKAASRSGSVIAEELLTGSEHSAEIILDREGRELWFNCGDRFFNGVIEIGHVNPSQLSALQQEQICLLLHRAADALGVNLGAFKADIIWTETGPVILECTARLSGGFDSTHTQPLAYGVSPVEMAMRVACGMETFPLEKAYHRGAAACGIFPKLGRVVSLPDAPRVIWRVGVGDIIGEYENCADRAGFVIESAAVPAVAWENAEGRAREIAGKVVTE